MNTLGSRLKELRQEKKLKQSDLSELISVTLRQIQRYEKNETDIPLSKAIILADFFNVSLDYLTGRSNQRYID